MPFSRIAECHSSGGDPPESQCWLITLVGQPSVNKSGPNWPKMDKSHWLPGRTRLVPSLLCTLMFCSLSRFLYLKKIAMPQNDDFLKNSITLSRQKSGNLAWVSSSQCLRTVKAAVPKSHRDGEGIMPWLGERGWLMGPLALQTRSHGSVDCKQHLPDLPQVPPPVLHLLLYLCHLGMWGVL